MNLVEGRIKRIIGVIIILALAVLAAICGWTVEEERYAAQKEAEKGNTDIGKMTEEERNEADIYWELAKARISDMLLENESIQRESVRKGYELFSDEWYAHEHRLTNPYLYMFPCMWYDETKTDPSKSPEEDLTYMGVEHPHRAGDHKGYFIFSVWVKETDHGVELGTDFHQKMFQYILYECSKEHYEEKAYLAGVSPSENWMWWYPLYDILGEPVVMVSVTEAETLEPVFRDACECMYERQEQISGELGQTVRFGAVFDDHSLAWRDEDELDYRDFDKEYWKREDYRTREQKYDAYMIEQDEVKGYLRWLKRYGKYYPEFRLDFHTGYDEEKQNIFREMCEYREEYVEMRLAKEEAKKEEQQESAQQEEVEQEEAQENTPREEQALWTVKAGDSLWKIAMQQYGDGRLWRRIYERNREVIGEDGSCIFPGQMLELP